MCYLDLIGLERLPVVAHDELIVRVVVGTTGLIHLTIRFTLRVNEPWVVLLKFPLIIDVHL